MNRAARNILREVANEMLSDADLLSNKSVFSCILLAKRVHTIHLNSCVGSLTETDVHNYVESLGKLFVSHIQLHPESLGFELLNPIPPARGAFVHRFADYGRSDVYDSEERFVFARKAWLKFVIEQ